MAEITGDSPNMRSFDVERIGKCSLAAGDFNARTG